MIHRFNDEGMASLDPRWAGGRPRRITADDEDFIVGAATTRPEALGLPFTRWSLRKLAAYLGDNQTRVVKISVERLRQILAARGVTVDSTRTLNSSGVSTTTASTRIWRRCSRTRITSEAIGALLDR